MTYTISKIDWAYAAGIIDGEGSLSVVRGRTYGKHGMLTLSVSSTDLELCLWLEQKFGGCIVTQKKYSPKHAQCHVWKMKNRAVLQMLVGIRPYLKIRRKSTRAQLMLDHWSRCTPRNGRYTDELLKEKHQLIEAILAIRPEIGGHHVPEHRKFI